MSKKKLPAIVWQEEKWYVAKTVGIELASQGKSRVEALKNLQEALGLLLEDEEIKMLPVSLPKNVELKQVYA